MERLTDEWKNFYNEDYMREEKLMKTIQNRNCPVCGRSIVKCGGG